MTNNTRLHTPGRLARILFAASALALAIPEARAQAPAPVSAAEDSVYARLYAEFSRHPNRLAGSTNLAACLTALESELRTAGLEPHRQTFRTLVQETEHLAFTYAGKPVEGALMVDNGPAPFVLEAPIEGPVVFVGNGAVEALDGKNLKGAIAVVDATLPGVRLPDVFMLGAKAVVLVGDDSASQWRMARVCGTTVSLIPRIYVPREQAAAAGLLAAEGSARGVIDARALLQDRDGVNLWVELPSAPGWTGALEREEVLVLSARLDTYGFTPDYCPERRLAANAALLADVAVALAKGPPLNRRVVVVFFGAHYAGQDGARYFYHAVDMTDAKANAATLPIRAARYAEELASVEEHLAFARERNVIDSRSSVARELRQRLKKELVSAVSAQREPMGNLRRDLAALRKAPADEAAKARIAALEAQIAEGDAQRLAWNDLRAQIFKGLFRAGDPANEALYRQMMAGVVADLERRRAEIVQMIADNRTWMELGAVFQDRELVAHFDFDFANDRDPWLLAMINASGLYRFAALGSGDYLRHLSAIARVYYGDDAAGIPGVSAGKDWTATLFKPALKPVFKPYSLCTPNQRVVPSVVGAGLGLAGFQMMTVGDSLAHDALPFADDVDLAGLRGQMRDFCRALGDSLELSLRPPVSREKMEERFLYTDERGATRGVNFLGYAPGSTDSEGVPDNSIMQFSGISMTDMLCGQSHLPRTRIFANGFIYMPMVSRSVAVSGWRSRVIGIGYGPDGAFERISVDADSAGVVSTPVHLFYAYGGVIFNSGYAPDPLGGTLYDPKTIIAAKDAKHRTAGSFRIADGYLEFFADRPDPIKRIGGNGDMVLGSVDTGKQTVDDETIQAAMGRGFPLEAGSLLNFDGIAMGAHDAFLLNDVRLRTLRERNIVRDDLEELHADAREHVEAAEKEGAQRRWSLARAHQIFATCIENRVYRPLRGVTEDLVQAVVVLLLLNIPFAFAMERLIFGFTSIYKQLLGFCGFFVATFLVLFFTHPAFSLASAPIIIFLAFVIILLSVITAAIMMGKIKQEIRAIQGLASTVHGIESDNSTMLSAVLIGISGMRNRPLKTFLTSITVVLLTFTILVFASFTPQEGVVESYLGRGAGASRIELHRQSFLDIDSSLAKSVEILQGEQFDVFRRGGVFRVPTRGGDTGTTPLLPERVLYLPRTQKTAALSAVAGYDPGEFVRNPDLGKVAPGFGRGEFAHPPLYLPKLLEDELQAETGDTLLLNGLSFTYAGTFDTGALQGLSTLDDLRVVPPDFQSTLANRGRTATEWAGAALFEEMSSGSFEWLSSETIALARIADLQGLLPEVNATTFLVLYPKSDAVELEREARKLATVFQGAVHVKSPEGTRRMFFTRAVEGSGFADVVVPLLLGGLIIFSSLMGSIVDREREIFTYSALGLSPPNVGALFFAESAVYSVIGGMGGYLLSQVVAKGFGALGRLGLMTPPEMNFSSLTSVCTILIVMAVVMLSTIFPALRASRSANPGVARKWKMPTPEGDQMRFVFPFTVSEVDFSGILSFIREHFSNHSDATLGSFAAKNVKLFRLPGAKGGRDAIGIEADVSLAPFDLGIFQKFRMYSSEFDIPGIDEVVVELRRIGGTPTSWRRSNRAFADELRRQFLLWRSLPVETVEHYRTQTARTLAASDAPQA